MLTLACLSGLKLTKSKSIAFFYSFQLCKRSGVCIIEKGADKKKGTGQQGKKRNENHCCFQTESIGESADNRRSQCATQNVLDDDAQAQ